METGIRWRRLSDFRGKVDLRRIIEALLAEIQPVAR